MAFTQGISTINRLAANFPVTSNLTPADITGFSFAVGPLKRIKWKFRAVFTLGATGGFRFLAHNSHAPTIYNAEWNVAEGATPQDLNLAQSAEAAFANAAAHAATYYCHAEGEIEQDATGGTFSIQFAQNTSDAATATILAGATLEIIQF
jgi:hypothetical protein